MTTDQQALIAALREMLAHTPKSLAVLDSIVRDLAAVGYVEAKLREIVMNGEQVRVGATTCPSIQGTNIVNLGRDALNRLGRSMPLPPSRTAFPSILDPRSPEVSSILLAPPTATEQAEVDHHHLQPEKVKLP